MKNKLTDLNNHLFAQLERLGDESLAPEKVEEELARTKGIVDISTQIINNATVALKGAELMAKHGVKNWETAIPLINEKVSPAPKGIPNFAKGVTE